MLIAAIRSGSPLAGKAVSYSEDDGKFWLTGVGEIQPERLVEYEQAGELEWADDATRSWALQKAGGGQPAPQDHVVRPPAPAGEPPAGDGTPKGSAPGDEHPPAPPAYETGPAPAATPAPQREALIPAPLARRGKRAERPEFVAGEKRRWRPSEVQWRIGGYVVIGLVFIAAVVVMGIWQLDSDDAAVEAPAGVVVQLQGDSSAGSDPFDLDSGAYRLTFTASRSSMGSQSDYTFCVVPADTPADQYVNYAVEQGIIAASLAAGSKSGEVMFERPAGTYRLEVLSSNCTWIAEVSGAE